MAKLFSEYIAGRPVATGLGGASDRSLVFQEGTVKLIEPGLTAVLLDSGGSGKRFQVTITYTGLADDGVTPILALNGVEV